MSYDFSTLNDKDLEELVRDILSVKLKIEFQSFKIGPDKGIDLRYSTNNNENQIIVQVKHFLDSGLTKLKSVLKKDEVPKVIRLKPQRYIFVTSLPLNPQDKEQIKSIFSPYIKSTSDILGKHDLNSFLHSNPTVVERHFKLWLSDVTVLKRILHNGTKGRSEFFEKKIKDRFRIFVPNKTHKLAVDLLNKYNFILITGAPGIGKTTLANILTYQLLAEDFELIYLREIREAEDLYSPTKKQVFYFDDFLGAIELDLKSSRNGDSAIVNFIERIKSDQQKRLILTSRTVILNQAKEESDKIENSKIELSNYEVKIADYRNIDKARILYNHIYFSNLSDELKSIFFKNNFYWQVIKHVNYNPRVIEFFTDIDRLQPGLDYGKEVLDFLEDPSKIWEKSYLKQISAEARLFLSTLYSLGGKYVIEEEKIKRAFEVRLDYEVIHNNYIKNPALFNKVVKELLGGFINRTIKQNNTYSTIEYRFLNPSIQDFMYYYFSKNIDEYFVILKSAITIGQFRDRISTKQNNNAKRIYFGEGDKYAKLKEIFFNRFDFLEGTGPSKSLDFVVALIRLFEWKDIREKVVEIVNNLNLNSLNWWSDSENLIEILDYIADKNIIDEFEISIKDLLLLLSDDRSYYYQIEAFSKLISKHNVYREYIENSKLTDEEYYSRIQKNIDESWKKSWEYFISQTFNINKIVTRDGLTEMIEKRKLEAKKMNRLLNLNSSPIIDEFIFDFDKQLSRNITMQTQDETQIKSLQDEQDVINEPLEINRLFNSNSEEEWGEVPF